MNPEKRVLSPVETIQEYGLSQAHQKRFRKLGLLKFIRIGHRTCVYRREDIERCLDRLTVK